MSFILVLDTETCGIPSDKLPDNHPAQPPLVQLGCLLIDEDNGAEVATLELIVRPDGWTIPDSAARIHGITTALATAAGVPLSLVVPAYVHLRARARAIVAHNPKFDLAIMRQAIARNGKPVTLPGPEEAIDTGVLAAPWCAIEPTDRMKEYGRGKQFKTPKLMEAYTFLFGREFPGAHGALSDARACAEIYFEIGRLKSEAGAAKLLEELK